MKLKFLEEILDNKDLLAGQWALIGYLNLLTKEEDKKREGMQDYDRKF